VVVLARAAAPLHGVGGLERHVLDLIRHLSRRGVRVTLITRPPRPGATGSLDGEIGKTHFVPYLTFPFAGRRGTTVIDRSSAYPLFGWRAGRLAARLVRAGGVHIVHGLGASAWGYAEARRRDWLGTVPFVFNPQGLEEFGATDPGRATLKLVAYRPLQAVVRRTSAAADRVIATDHALVPTVLRHLGVQASRVRVVPNAIDLDEVDRFTQMARAHDVRQHLGLRANDVLLVSVGRLEENKGFQHLIAALARLRGNSSTQRVLGEQWRLVIVGEGPHRPRLERDAAAAGLTTHVVFPGRLADAELHAWYEAATLFVHPTLYEGSSLVTLEAMAHRRAIVGTRAGGLPDKIRPGQNGWLIEPGDSGALSNALAEALGNTHRLAAMGAASREIVTQEFAWPAIADRLVAVYREVLSTRQPTGRLSTSDPPQ
jgi:glycosyltransferase involved in cell wall biosynthesis